MKHNRIEHETFVNNDNVSLPAWFWNKTREAKTTSQNQYWDSWKSWRHPSRTALHVANSNSLVWAKTGPELFSPLAQMNSCSQPVTASAETNGWWWKHKKRSENRNGQNFYVGNDYRFLKIVGTFGQRCRWPIPLPDGYLMQSILPAVAVAAEAAPLQSKKPESQRKQQSLKTCSFSNWSRHQMFWRLLCFEEISKEDFARSCATVLSTVLSGRSWIAQKQKNVVETLWSLTVAQTSSCVHSNIKRALLLMKGTHGEIGSNLV